MIDYVYVKIGNERLFIEKATDLGYSELVLCYVLPEAKQLTSEMKDKLVDSTDLKLFFGIIDEIKQISLKNNLFEKQIALGTSLKTSFRGLTEVYDNEFTKEKDAIHQRRAGLNHTILNEFREKNINVLFSIINFENLREIEKPTVLGRAKQNLKACRRANTNYLLVSLAKRPEEMKSLVDLKALRKILEQPN